MPTSLKIEKQRFHFADGWFVFRYDETNFYQKKVKSLQRVIDGIPHGTKAVDVVGLHQHSSRDLLLLEAKDFRGYRIENQRRIDSGEVATEVAMKVRDTVASLVGAARHAISEFPAGEVVQAMEKGKISVVLWIEDDTFQDEARTKVKLDALNKMLKRTLAWLHVRTFVLSSKVPYRLPGLNVVNLAGAGQKDKT